MHPCSAPSKSATSSITAVIPKTSVAVPIAVEEARVQIQTAAEPSTPPSPASPASPVGVIGAHVVSRTKSESETVDRRRTIHNPIPSLPSLPSWGNRSSCSIPDQIRIRNRRPPPNHPHPHPQPPQPPQLG